MIKSKREVLDSVLNGNKKRTVIVPLDHGVSSGPMDGINDMGKTIKAMNEGGADMVIVHKGIYKLYKKEIGSLPTFIHISASTDLANSLKKVLVASPYEVAQLGAQGVSIHVNLGNEFESQMLEDLGWVSAQCEELGLPLLAMMYVRDSKNGEIVNDTSVQSVAFAARIAAELGADIVKVAYTGNPEDFKKVTESCPIPVVIAGGAKGSEEQILQSVEDCISAGACGVSAGRNIFQHNNPAEMVKKVKNIVHKK